MILWSHNWGGGQGGDSISSTCICQAHDASEGVYEFLKNAHKFQEISYSGIISFMYVGKEEILKYM